MSASLISIRQVSVSLGSTEALHSVSLDVLPGEVVALAGPSGSGKSTLLRVVLGLTAPRSGSVVIAGEEASRDGKLLVPAQQRRLAMVFQDLALWPHMTVTGNLEFALRSQGVSRREMAKRIAGVLARVDLTGKAFRRPIALSGGERQRIALARALVQEPRAMLLDEPLASLDVLLKQEMLVFMRELFIERRFPVLFATHDGYEAAALADRVVVLEVGEIVQQGSLQEISTQPASDFVRAFVESANRG